MLSTRIVGYICSRNFTKGLNLTSRFTRDGLRDRLRHQEIKELTKNREFITNGRGVNSSAVPPDARSVRPISHLWKALQFTIVTGATSFTVAIIAEIISTRNQKQKENQNVYEMVKNFFVYPDGSQITVQEESKVRELTAGEKQVALLIGINFAVYLLWRVKKITPFMQRYFTNSYASKSLCAPMILSAFSHSSFIHFAMNMYVTTTFATKLIDQFVGVEQFWAFYLTAAAVSSLVSLADKAIARIPIRALGASGAILAILTYTCMQIPDARLSIIFVPGFDFSAQNAVYGIIALDLIGLLMRWRIFDHAAHLGGSLFGVGYALYGQNIIWEKYGQYIEDLFKNSSEK